MDARKEKRQGERLEVPGELWNEGRKQNCATSPHFIYTSLLYNFLKKSKPQTAFL
jgi:hypothetical protein